MIFKNLIPELEQLNIELMMLDSQEVFDLIRNHEIHFGIIEKPMMDETIETFPLFKDELVLAGNPESDIFLFAKQGLVWLIIHIIILKKIILIQRIWSASITMI